MKRKYETPPEMMRMVEPAPSAWSTTTPNSVFGGGDGGQRAAPSKSLLLGDGDARVGNLQSLRSGVSKETECVEFSDCCPLSILQRKRQKVRNRRKTKQKYESPPEMMRMAEPAPSAWSTTTPNSVFGGGDGGQRAAPSESLLLGDGDGGVPVATASQASMNEDNIADTDVPPGYDQALHYVCKIKRRFRSEKHVYKAFVEIVMKSRNGHIIIPDLCKAVERLFTQHADLVAEFRHFLPHGTGPTSSTSSLTSLVANLNSRSEEACTSKMQGQSQQPGDSSGYSTVSVPSVIPKSTCMRTSLHSLGRALRTQYSTMQRDLDTQCQ